MESAAYILQMHPDPWLEERMEELVGLIVAHQQEDGYFNVYFTVVEPENRFRQRFAHELYCAGHLIEAAVAYQNATGRDRFLRAMCPVCGLHCPCFHGGTGSSLRHAGP